MPIDSGTGVNLIIEEGHACIHKGGYTQREGKKRERERERGRERERERGGGEGERESYLTCIINTSGDNLSMSDCTTSLL